MTELSGVPAYNPRYERRLEAPPWRGALSSRVWLAFGRQSGSVVPRKPLFGSLGHLGAVFQQSREILEGVFPCQLAGVDEAHEDIPDVCPAGGLVKVGVLAIMQSFA
jgi:hypothetical protein